LREFAFEITHHVLPVLLFVTFTCLPTSIFSTVLTLVGHHVLAAVLEIEKWIWVR